MRAILKKYDRITLVAGTTLFSITCTYVLIFFVYSLMDTKIRPIEWFIGTLAPASIAPLVTWYLFGLLKELDSLEHEMRGLATNDLLTNVLVRREFFNRAAEHYRLAKRTGNGFFILMVDLDHFKKINDSLGHSAGDYVLKKFGEILNENRRETDLIGRYGGEEFIFLLWGGEGTWIKNYTDRLHRKLKQLELSYEDQPIQLTMSVGVSCLFKSEDKIELSEMIEQADGALYEAKKSGRNQTVFYNELRN